MEKKMTFNYFYGTEADQFSFYRIPKVLFTDSYFKDLSSDAKILYGLMLDRMSLSIKNQWFDDKNRAYIYFSIEDIMELLNCGRNKAIKSMRELDDETGIGLIEKRRQGFGKVNVIYVKTFMPEKTDEKKFGEELKKFKKQTSVENEESTEVYNSNFMKSQNQTSRSPENKLQEVYISNPNNTNLSDTEMNDNKSNHIISVDEKRFDSDNHSEDYQAFLERQLGKMGLVIYSFANVWDDSPVSVEGYQAPIKSIGNSTTTPRDLENDQDVQIILMALAESVADRLRKHGFKCNVVSISIRDNGLFHFSRQRKLQDPTDITDEIMSAAYQLFRENYHWPRPIRSLGIRADDLVMGQVPVQLDLFMNEQRREKQEKLDRAVDDIRRRFGYHSVQRAFMYQDKILSSLDAQGSHTVHPVGYFNGR